MWTVRVKGFVNDGPESDPGRLDPGVTSLIKGIGLSGSKHYSTVRRRRAKDFPERDKIAGEYLTKELKVVKKAETDEKLR